MFANIHYIIRNVEKLSTHTHTEQYRNAHMYFCDYLNFIMLLTFIVNMKNVYINFENCIRLFCSFYQFNFCKTLQGMHDIVVGPADHKLLYKHHNQHRDWLRKFHQSPQSTRYIGCILQVRMHYTSKFASNARKIIVLLLLSL